MTKAKVKKKARKMKRVATPKPPSRSVLLMTAEQHQALKEHLRQTIEDEKSDTPLAKILSVL